MATKKPIVKPLHRAKLNIKRGDTVLVITGKDRGKRGTVSRALPRQEKVIVEGINLVKKHVKAGRASGQPGIIEKAMPLHVSNVMLICTNCGEPTRVAHDRRPQGTDQKLRVVRLCKKCHHVIEDRTRS
jgi:large subunit ribosomal protein L24